MRLISPTSCIGEIVEYSIPDTKTLTLRQSNLCKYLDNELYIPLFKSDIFVDTIVERHFDASIYYVTTDEGRGEELYYFKFGNSIFHGQKIWSQFHPFVMDMIKTEPSFVVHEPSWFVGTKNNYTHQLIDMFPNLLILDDYIKSSKKNITSVIGKSNSIYEMLCTHSNKFCSTDISSRPPTIQLDTVGNAKILENGWQIKCVKFNELYVVRHLSIFKAYYYLEKFFQKIQLPLDQTDSCGFLTRKDNRIANQDAILNSLRPKNIVPIDNLQDLSFDQKSKALCLFTKLLLPPGSDNINAFIFASKNCHFYQLLSEDLTTAINNPFLSFAGLRYMLPFLDRTSFILPKERYDLLSGKWNPDDIFKLI